MKRKVGTIFKILLVVSLIFLLFPSAYAETASGTCGINKGTMKSDDSVIWEYDADTATLSFKGDGYIEFDYYASDSPWSIYRENIRHIILHDGVKCAGNFTNLYNLETLAVADSVEYFPVCSESAASAGVINSFSPFFKNKDNWKNGLLYAGKHVVATNSEKIVGDFKIADGTISVADGTFQCCDDLTYVTFPDSVTYIGIYTFMECPKLTGFKLPANIKGLNFQFGVALPSLEEIIIPDGVEEVRGAFFDLANLKSVTIPVSVKNLHYSFAFCENITDVYYLGTEAQWNEIITYEEYSYEIEDYIYTKMEEKPYFKNATIHFGGAEPTPSYKIGDSNGDTAIDIMDVISMRRFIAGGYGIEIVNEAADVNKDTLIDIKDVIMLRRFIAGGYGIELK